MKKLYEVGTESVFKTPRMEAVKVCFCDENGKHVLAHTVIHSNPSVAIIVRRDGYLAFIRQFRSTTGKYYIEIPAGLLNDGENETEATVRETREETGLLVKNVEVLVKGPSLLDPSKSNENYGVAVADVYGEKSQALDSDEQIDSNIIWLPEEEVFNRLKKQMFEGTAFWSEENLYMSGHSLYALMAYMISKL